MNVKWVSGDLNSSRLNLLTISDSCEFEIRSVRLFSVLSNGILCDSFGRKEVDAEHGSLSVSFYWSLGAIFASSLDECNSDFKESDLCIRFL